LRTLFFLGVSPCVGAADGKGSGGDGKGRGDMLGAGSVGLALAVDVVEVGAILEVAIAIDAGELVGEPVGVDGNDGNEVLGAGVAGGVTVGGVSVRGGSRVESDMMVPGFQWLVIADGGIGKSEQLVQR
jgi:hypothetical protein